MGEAGCFDENGKLIADTVFTASEKIKQLSNVYVFDNEAFNNNMEQKGMGEIVIKIDPNIDLPRLGNECPNFHRIDIYLKKVEVNTNKPELNKFIWEGIQLEKNRSMYNSILGAINDAKPEGKVIYSFYLKTYN